jgi:8-oxo-dGTP diphosphatase
MKELIDIFDEHWNPTGETLEKSEAERQGKLHKTVHIWIVNPRGELLLQRRSPTKKTYPNTWDIPAAGHIHTGETVMQGGIREAYEELGINIIEDQLIFISKQEEQYGGQHLCTEFLLKLDLPINSFTFNDSEVAEVKYIHWRELAKMNSDEMLENGILPHKGLGPLFAYLEKNVF